MNGIAWMEKRYYNDVVLTMSEFTRGTTLERYNSIHAGGILCRHLKSCMKVRSDQY